MTTKIMIVGEAWGQEEAAAHLPFVGMSGKFLNSMLRQVGINRDECFLTNVFNLQPQPKNDVLNLCGPKTEALPGYPAIKSGKYITAQYAAELTRLYAEIKTECPTLIIALGATASWALLGTTGIKKLRGAPSLTGTVATAAVGKEIKVFPTYHPAAVMREYSLRPYVIADLEKAKREAEFPDLRRPHREIWIGPSLDDLAVFERDYILHSNSLSIDIETAGDQITCVGFSPTIDRAVVVPITDPTQRDGNYWRTLADELTAWEYIRRWCAMTIPVAQREEAIKALPYKRGVGQNFLYDAHFLWRRYGIRANNEDDTMLLHHALQPEMEKGLGLLATVYTDELPWKFMRPKHETVKKED